MRRYVFGLVMLSACGRLGFTDEPRPDALAGDAGDPTLEHIVFDEPGWTAEVFYDFSVDFIYSAQEFIDGLETYSNLPEAMFTLRAPYPEALCVIAGRELLVIDGTTLQRHDLGNHAPNQLDLPDDIRSGVWLSNFDAGNPSVVITSSSDSAGDGVLSVSTQWMSTTRSPQNNVRAFLWDETGTFDALGVPTGYMATSNGLRRFTDGSVVLGGDTKSAIVRGPDIYLTRTVTIDVDVRVIRVGSMSAGMYPEFELAQSAEAELGEGVPAGGAFAWVLFDDRRLARIEGNNALTAVAQSTDADSQWQGAVTPPAGHPLASANIVYVLETNLAARRFRVLALRGPG